MFDSDPTTGFRIVLSVVLIVSGILIAAYCVHITNYHDTKTTTNTSATEETYSNNDWLIYQNMLNMNNLLLH